MVILSGSYHQNFAKRLSRLVGCTMVRREIGKFSNGEIRVCIQGEVTGENVVLVQSLYPAIHEATMELLLLADAAKRNGAREVTAVIPWIAYSKQNKAFRAGEPNSASILGQLLSTPPIDRIITVDLHDPAIAKFYTVAVVDLSADTVFAAQFHRASQNTVVVSPDAGGESRSKVFAGLINAPVVLLKKSRSMTSGAVTYGGMSEPVSKKHCILFDDMVVTGETVIQATMLLKRLGASSVTWCVTHGLCSEGFKKFDEIGISRLYFTDSLSLPRKIPTFVKVISIAPLIARALRQSA